MRRSVSKSLQACFATAAFFVCLCGCQSQTASAKSETDHTDAVRAARAVMAEFLETFNRRDVDAWSQTLHFPHVRFAGQAVSVFPDRVSFVVASDLHRFAEETGWAFSRWDRVDLIQASANKVHFAVTFSRYRADHERMATYDSLYILEKIGGRWGIRSRSSFAP